MERTMVISATVSASMHVLVLFGFGSDTGRARVAADQPKPTCGLHVEPRLPEEIIAIRPADDTEDKTATPAPAPEPAPAVGPEPPATAVPDITFTIPVPPTRPDVVPGITVNPTRPFAAGLTGGVSEGGGGGTLVDFRGLDNPPRTRLQAAPLYPYDARREGRSGEVLVEFTVDESGRVREARAVRSTHAGFEDAALRAVARWVFEPGRRHGRVVAFRMAVPIVFNVGD